VGRPLRGLYTFLSGNVLLWPSPLVGMGLFLCWFLRDRIEEVDEAL
jgi:hypothetical protein